MSEPDWLGHRRRDVEDYLRREGVEHGEIGECPAWFVAPYVSIWAIESKAQPGYVGWWVIAGDLPTDYVSAKDIKHPREAMRAIAVRWSEQADLMAQGGTHRDLTIGDPADWPELAPLLKSRSRLLREWADDDEIWDDTGRTD